MHGVSKGLTYLHEKRISHLDMHPGNIVLQDTVPKIIDFELSQFFDKRPELPPIGEGSLHNRCTFHPPEVLAIDTKNYIRTRKKLHCKLTEKKKRSQPYENCLALHTFVSSLREQEPTTPLAARDIWGFGMITFAMCNHGKTIYDTNRVANHNLLYYSLEMDDNRLLHTVQKTTYFQPIDLIVQKLITGCIIKCFDKDPKKRISASEITQILAAI